MPGTTSHKRPFTVKKIRPQTPKRLTIAVMFHQLSVNQTPGRVPAAQQAHARYRVIRFTGGSGLIISKRIYGGCY